MNLSEHTVNVLKNFAGINSGIVIRPGKLQSTVCPESLIYAEADLVEDFPYEFGIYDLNQFLSNITTLKNVELTFSEKKVTMSDGEMSFDYMACSPNLIVTPPSDYELVMEDVSAKFSLKNATFQKFLKIATMNNLPDVTIIRKNNELFLKTHERTNDTTNQGIIKLQESVGDDLVTSFNKDNFKILPLDYEVELQVGAFSKFTSLDGKLRYFIAASIEQ